MAVSDKPSIVVGESHLVSEAIKSSASLPGNLLHIPDVSSAGGPISPKLPVASMKLGRGRASTVSGAAPSISLLPQSRAVSSLGQNPMAASSTELGSLMMSSTMSTDSLPCKEARTKEFDKMFGEETNYEPLVAGKSRNEIL